MVCSCLARTSGGHTTCKAEGSNRTPSEAPVLEDNILFVAVAVAVVIATILLPAAAVGLTLWTGGMNPSDEDAGTPPRA
ncbi:MAG: hypothetical protein ACI8S6_001668 [Myxococcota bacterium]|jgi:hypothetical protein